MAALLLRGLLYLGEPWDAFRKQQFRHRSSPTCPTMVFALSHESLENKTLLMVPMLYLWFLTRWYECNVHMVEVKLGTLIFWSLLHNAGSCSSLPAM